MICQKENEFLADGRTYATVLSVICRRRRLSVRNVLWLNDVS